MQTATITLALGGDRGNTVPKYNVTPAEVAIMRAIHGNEAVFDIDPQPGKSPLSNRQELSRLRGIYGGAKDSENNSIIDSLYPGAAARVFEDFEELELDESFFKPVTRRSAGSGEIVAPAAPKRAKKAARPQEPAVVEEPDEDADKEGDAEIGDMPDTEPSKPAGDTLFA